MTVLDLTALTLTVGEHTPGSDRMCLLEAVAYIAGETWSDHPECVSPVLGAYGRSLNDTLPYETRQRLVSFIPRLLNTAGDGLDERRSYLALDWLTRTHLPAWLRLVPSLTKQADLLAAASEVTDLATANGIIVLVREAASQAEDARVTAQGEAGTAAWDAAGYAAEAAAGHAAGYAARTAAGEAARAASGYAARRAAGNAARVAALASGNSAEAFLAPTVTALQDSAIDLFDRMLTVTK